MSSQDEVKSKTANVNGNDLLSTYHLISGKLKKRFLRKPNVAEASDQFESLAASCEQQELHQYAGWCWLAAARCQGTLGNCPSEIQLLTRAGRQFLKADRKKRDIGCLSMGAEDSQAAVNAFNHALARCEHEERPGGSPAGLARELAAALGASPEGIGHLSQAAQRHPTAEALSLLASRYTQQGDYASALQVLSELVEMIEGRAGPRPAGSQRAALHRCEVSRVLLLLLLRPTPQRLAPGLARVLEKYAWAEDSGASVPNMTEDELLLLQSLVLACQSGDREALQELESELWLRLDTEQKQLLRKLVQAYSGE